MFYRHSKALIVLIAAALQAAIGCGPGRPTAAAPTRLQVSIRADTGRGERLPIAPPRASVWIERAAIAPTRVRAAARLGELPPPEPPPDTIPPAEPVALDHGLKPPLLRTAAALVVPAHARRGGVELEIRVDERGEVTDARPAGAEGDTALVAAAQRCARSMRFYPALKDGRPVAVWCRQRFDFVPR